GTLRARGFVGSRIVMGEDRNIHKKTTYNTHDLKLEICVAVGIPRCARNSHKSEPRLHFSPGLPGTAAASAAAGISNSVLPFHQAEQHHSPARRKHSRPPL